MTVTISNKEKCQERCYFDSGSASHWGFSDFIIWKSLGSGPECKLVLNWHMLCFRHNFSANYGLYCLFLLVSLCPSVQKHMFFSHIMYEKYDYIIATLCMHILTVTVKCQEAMFEIYSSTSQPTAQVTRCICYLRGVGNDWHNWHSKGKISNNVAGCYNYTCRLCI